MKFYNRETELKQLQILDQQANETGIMTVLTGRRRIGKTGLALQFVKDKPSLYLFVSRKTEALLCQEYINDINEIFETPVLGEFKNFKDVFALLLERSKQHKFTLIIDEFQDFYKINPSIYSDMQKLWDLNKAECKIHVIFAGSVYSLMHKIFENNKEPLFGRADQIFKLKPFPIRVLSQILKDRNIYSPRNLFDFYLITGGVPKYLDILLKYKAKDKEEILDIILSSDSFFINEGKNVLIEEFGKNYSTYFSILELISYGKASRSEMESILQKNIGGFLEKMEKDYGVIKPFKPINARPQSKTQRYQIIDNFLCFWFHYIYTHRSAIEMGNFKYVRAIITKNYDTFSGRVLENFFQQLLAETEDFNQIGHYWERGNENELDVVAINNMEKRILIGETKLNKKKINMNIVEQKAEKLLKHYPGFKVEYVALGIEDIERYLD